jgi:hypothetical protein
MNSDEGYGLQHSMRGFDGWRSDSLAGVWVTALP